MAAVFGSGRQQVACDEKFSAEPDWGGQGGAWQWEAGYKGKKGGDELRGRWERSREERGCGGGVEVGEPKVMNRQVT